MISKIQNKNIFIYVFDGAFNVIYEFDIVRMWYRVPILRVTANYLVPSLLILRL
jgi:hypothetical protein